MTVSGCENVSIMRTICAKERAKTNTRRASGGREAKLINKLGAGAYLKDIRSPEWMRMLYVSDPFHVDNPEPSFLVQCKALTAESLASYTPNDAPKKKPQTTN